MQTHHIYTPDGDLLTFSKVAKAQLLSQIEQGVFVLAEGSFPWQAQEQIFLTKSGECLYLYESMDYGHLFASQSDFEKSITGHNYSNSTLLYDKQEKLRCAFELDFDNAFAMVSQYTHIDTNYPSSEGYLVYCYANKTICYVAHYNHPIQRQGYWFISKTDFDYFFYKVFTS